MIDECGNIGIGRVNFDDLRASVFNGKWSGKREDIIRDMGRAMIEVLNKHGFNAVVDNTNLTAGHIERYKHIGRELSMPVEVQYHMPEGGLRECIARDSVRNEGRVGRGVIENMALRNGYIKFDENAKYVLVDMDGTLADCRWRQRFVNGGTRDWSRFFALCGGDPAISVVRQWVQNLYPEYKVIIVSGRPDGQCGDMTAQWLDKHHIRYEHLFMRRGHDKRPDDIVKAEILSLLPKNQIAFVIDDRPSVVRMWREQGLTVYPVAGACEEF